MSSTLKVAGPVSLRENKIWAHGIPDRMRYESSWRRPDSSRRLESQDIQALLGRQGRVSYNWINNVVMSKDVGLSEVGPNGP